MKKWNIVTSDALDAAVRAKCAETGETLSEVVRKLMAKWAGVKKADAAVAPEGRQPGYRVVSGG